MNNLTAEILELLPQHSDPAIDLEVTAKAYCEQLRAGLRPNSPTVLEALLDNGLLGTDADRVMLNALRRRLADQYAAERNKLNSFGQSVLGHITTETPF